MTPLAAYIHNHIATNGAMRVRDYVDLCMNHPEFGYYRVQKPIGNDFITAPEISPLFGQALGFWVLQQWIDLGSPPVWQLIELGAGKGTLMKDIMHVLAHVPACTAGLTVTLVECNPHLRDHQKRAMKSIKTSIKASVDVCVTWVEGIDDLSVNAPHVVVANEFLDVLPTQSYHYNDGAFYPQYVHSHPPCAQNPNGAFSLQTHTVPEDIPGYWVHSEALRDGCVIETCPDYARVLGCFAPLPREHVNVHSGRYAFIDYGFTFGQKDADLQATLQGVQTHETKDIFHEPGRTDLSSHVNFHAFSAMARRLKMTADVCSQRQFLKNHGIDIRLNKLIDANKENQQELTTGYNRLIDDMGNLFYVVQLKI